MGKSLSMCALTEKNMKTYKSSNVESQVKAYQIYKDAIKIKFTDGSIYLYTYEKSGHRAVETMKVLANDQHGLGTYITENTAREDADKLED